MKMDRWTDRLSEYIDGELDATAVASLEQHLRDCEACRDIVADLRAIAADAAALVPVAPSKDLWTGIAAQIGAPAAAPAPDARVISLDSRRSPRRSITLSMPQIAAAAVILIALGGTAVWQLHPARTTTVASNDARNAGNPQVAQNAQNVGIDTLGGTGSSSTVSSTTGSSDNGTARPDAVPNATESSAPIRNGTPVRGSVINVSRGDYRPTLGYDAAIQQLEEAARQNEAQLDPKTKAVIAQSMVTIDRAIADARAALASDPANSYLHRHLDRTMKQKLELLRQAAKIDRGGA
jgi:hypothetical protein